MKVFWDRIDRDGWEAALPAAGAAMQHSWRYGSAAAALGRRVHRAEVWDGRNCLALAQVVVRRKGPLTLGYLPRGPVALQPGADGPAMLAALRRNLPGGGPRFLVTAGREGGLLPLMTPVTTAELRLSPEIEQMRARMRGKWRNRLRLAERRRMKIAVTTPNDAELSWLQAEDRVQGRARGYRGMSRAFLAAWSAGEGDPMRLYTARAGGEIVAAMLFLDHAPGVTYQLGWSGADGRSGSAHHRLLWRAMCDFARAGRHAIDLGPIDTVNAPGLARFKLGAGAAACDLGATGLVLPRPRILPLRKPSGRGNLRATRRPAE